MLQNDSGPYGGGPAVPTRLTLTRLPPHACIELHFLLAIIDTRDGDSGGCAPDIFNVTVDGQLVFSDSFTNFPDTHTASYPNALTPPGVILAQYYDPGFLDFEHDAAYDLGLAGVIALTGASAGRILGAAREDEPLQVGSHA